MSETERSRRLPCSMFSVYSLSVGCLVAFSDIIRLGAEFFHFGVSGIG